MRSVNMLHIAVEQLEPSCPAVPFWKVRQFSTVSVACRDSNSQEGPVERLLRGRQLTVPP